ncbi:MAG: choice-of-anchor tandem repeat GloVer-containing protein [Candidatus Sulfotelmatobacter sp.]
MERRLPAVPNGFGSVFELTPGTNNTWTEKVLYSFDPGSGGILPYRGVVRDPAGNLYGTTAQGGAYFNGTVFELVAGSNGSWTEKTLYSFTGVNDGADPETLLILDAAGNLYGTTTYAGPNDYGSVFELKRGGNGDWTLKTIYAFTGVSGLNPFSGLTFDSAGNLYGTSETTAFELMPGPNGKWTEKTLHAFTGGTDGAGAYSGLIFDKEGDLYGTTSLGGLHEGTVYELKPAAGSWTEKVLHRFAGGSGDGSYPLLPNLLRDASGNLYGTTPEGGSSGAGVVYEITP